MALEVELRHFDSIKEELLKHHEGKFALIIGTELIGTFDTAEMAYKKGIETRGNVPMLIKRISKDETPDTIPSMTFGLLRADS